MDLIIKFFIAFVVFLVIDLIWLGFVAKKLYNRYLGYLLAENVNWIAAIIFYILFVMGMMYFVIVPALDAGSWSLALISGAIYGFITYATYDLTNLSTVRDWPLKITIIDLIWGTSLSTLVSVISYFIITAIF